TRLLSCSSNKPTGSRDRSGVNSACDSSGATTRASFPRAARSARLGCSPVPARAESPPDLRGAALRCAASSVLTVMAAHPPPPPGLRGVHRGHHSTAREGELHPLDGGESGRWGNTGAGLRRSLVAYTLIKAMPGGCSRGAL